MKEGYPIWQQTIPTNEGDLMIEGPVSAEFLRSLQMDQGLKAFRPPSRQKEALIGICQLQDGRVIVGHRNGVLLSYVTFHPPDSFERWSQGPKQILELGAIEVSPSVRRYGVAFRLQDVSFSDPEMEKYLVLATEYYWHWDLEGSGLHIWEYREVMHKVMARIGMVVKDTDDEEIASHPANMLMVRYGKDVPHDAVLEFEKLLFWQPDSNRG